MTEDDAEKIDKDVMGEPQELAAFSIFRHNQRLPKSSVNVDFQLPDITSPPWVSLMTPNSPVVVRRYDPQSRTCDVVGDGTRWLLESCLVPLTPQMPHFLRQGWDLAIGPVQVGWAIIFVGNEMWFPQRILKVEAVSSDWQRVWTLGDMETRDIWSSSDFNSWDNGLSDDWRVDETGECHWSPDGPWWPLQSDPLGPRKRRFVLDKFDIAVECPACSNFGKPIVYGLPSAPLGPNVIAGGCDTTLSYLTYGCDCGVVWGIDYEGGHLHVLGSSLNVIDSSWPDVDFYLQNEEEKPLNYDMSDKEPYGEESEVFLTKWQRKMFDDAMPAAPTWEQAEAVERKYIGEDAVGEYWAEFGDEEDAEMERDYVDFDFLDEYLWHLTLERSPGEVGMYDLSAVNLYESGSASGPYPLKFCSDEDAINWILPKLQGLEGDAKGKARALDELQTSKLKGRGEPEKWRDIFEVLYHSRNSEPFLATSWRWEPEPDFLSEDPLDTTQSQLPADDPSKLVGYDRLVAFVNIFISLVTSPMSIYVRSQSRPTGVYVLIDRQVDHSFILQAAQSLNPPSTPAEITALHKLGWENPEPTFYNYHRQLTADELSPVALAEFLVNTLVMAYGIVPSDLFQFKPPDICRDLLNGKYGQEFAMNSGLSSIRKSRLHLGLSFPKCLDPMTAEEPLK